MNNVQKNEQADRKLNDDTSDDIELSQVKVDSGGNGQVNPAFTKDSSESIPNEKCRYADIVDIDTQNIPYEKNSNFLGRLQNIPISFEAWTSRHNRLLKRLLLLTLTVAYITYFVFAVRLSWSLSESWCQGSRFLTILTILATFGIIYFQVVKRYFGKTLNRWIVVPFTKCIDWISSIRFISIIAFFVLMGVMLIFVLVDSKGNQKRLISYAGIWVILFLGFVFSKHPGKVIVRHIAWGIGLQFVFALLILRWNVGREIFRCMGDKVAAFLAFTDTGANFVFSYLATGNMASGTVNITVLAGDGIQPNATLSVDMVIPQQMTIFAFKVLPVVIFFSFWVSVLYYYGVMQWVVLKVGWILQVTVGTTAAESMNAAGNIFMGQTEAPLLVKPYLQLMTKSELHAIMTGGFATIAGSVLAAYISLGISPSHLLSASVMSAPAALAYSKLFYPETEESQTTISTIRIEKGKERNALEAASAGVSQSISLVANIGANLIAFVAFIYFIDYLVMWFGSLVGWDFLSFTYLMAKVFMPLAYVMGVPWDECDKIGELIGLKTVLNEFVAYDKLSKIKYTLSWRSQIIATYALCGFSNLSSIGIQLGGLGAMAPNKLPDLSSVAFRAMIAGSASCFLTACVAGVLLDEESISQ